MREKIQLESTGMFTCMEKIIETYDYQISLDGSLYLFDKEAVSGVGIVYTKNLNNQSSYSGYCRLKDVYPDVYKLATALGLDQVQASAENKRRVYTIEADYS